MEPLFVFLTLIILAVIVLTTVSDARTRRRNLDVLARRYGGVVTSAWHSDTDLEFTVDGARAHLDYRLGSKNSPSYTRLRFQTPFGTRLRVTPDGLWESLKKAFGAEDLEIGDDPGFDRDFIVQGFPSAWVRSVLNSEARARIRRLAAQGGGRVTLEAGPLGLLVSVPRVLLEDAAGLERFVEDGIGLCRGLRAPRTDDIQFMSEPAAPGSCPVCATPLGEAPRRCRSCATPHHAECWAYFGGCSTYACKENP